MQSAAANIQRRRGPAGLAPNGLVYRTGEQSAEDPREYVMSSEAVDRYGDIIQADAWELAHFRKNPIALYQHRSTEPIGTWSKVRVEGGQLRGRLNLADPGTSPRIDEIRALVDQRILRAVSVGFAPTKSPELLDEDNPWGGVKWVGQELLECSLVSVPANPEALALAMKLGIAERELVHYFGAAAHRGMSPYRARLELLKLRAAHGR